MSIRRALALGSAIALTLALARDAAAAGASLLLRGGTIYTVTGPVLKDADILVRDGVIARIGHNIPPGEGAKVIEVRGKVLMPGIVVPLEVSGLTRGAGSPPEGIDVFSTSMEIALSSGVTAVQARGHVVKLTFGEPGELVLAANEEVELSIGSWMARHSLAERLSQAREQLRQASLAEQAQREGKPARQPAAGPGGGGEYVRLLKGEIPARVYASDAQEILRVVSLAREYNFRVIIDGAIEAWAVAEEIGRAQATVVFSVRNLTAPQRDADAPPGSNPRAAAILRKAGVPFALVPPMRGVAMTSGFAGRDITSMAMEAAFAVRGGLDEPSALAAITIEPARVLGVAHRIGSLEEGKDADIIVLDGEPLYWKSFVELAIINGTVYFDRAKSRILPKG